ncbi:MAG: hypothetical protein B6I34_11565 [Anaerolineaceae bacterium 4572_32.1]|nr:MAG: hypothetical protein B6I34_11565 [Anaerolineaceae bacterium 4572_32.1]
MRDTKYEEHGEQSRHPELTTIHVVHGLLKAQVIQAKLEQAGIPVLLRYESIGPVMGITVDGLGEVHIQVPARYADEARVLIEEQ